MAAVVDLFAYDPAAPLNLQVGEVERRENVHLTEIRYDNGAGGTADAFVTEPVALDGAARPGVVVAHGGKRPGRHKLLDEALHLSSRGLIVLSADTSLPPLGDASADEAATVAAVLVQRRALDVLESVYGVTAVGYFGHSLGGERGAILSAVEPRLDAIVIAATGSALAEWVRRQGFSDETYLAAADRFDPVHFLGRPTTAHLLFQYGRQDPVVSLDSGRALYDAAAEPKTWLEYDCGHGVDAHAQARADRVAFFGECLAAA